MRILAVWLSDEEAGFHERVDRSSAGVGVQFPQPLELAVGQQQAGHFREFRADHIEQNV
ncbi:MAG TPA: hypothetical protein VH458_14145 [Vicinamibacterales bacterium]|jgi:hypothetical protein